MTADEVSFVGCEPIEQALGPVSPMRIVEIVDRAIGEVARRQRAADALFETTNAENLLAGKPMPRLEPSTRDQSLKLHRLER